jgi:hypothetical protein
MPTRTDARFRSQPTDIVTRNDRPLRVDLSGSLPTRQTAVRGGEPSLVRTYLNDPLGLEAAVPRLNLAAREDGDQTFSLSRAAEGHCGSRLG